MTSIHNRPSELLVRLREVLRHPETGLNKQLEEVNASLAEKKRRFRLPEFEVHNIDLALMPESMPEWTEEPMVFLVYLDELPDLKSPPNIQWANVPVLTQIYLNFDNLIIDDNYDDEAVPETDESTVKQSVLDALFAVRRTVMCYASSGGMHGEAGVDSVGIQQAPIDINGVPCEEDEDSGVILQATGGYYFIFGQESLV